MVVIIFQVNQFSIAKEMKSGKPPGLSIVI